MDMVSDAQGRCGKTREASASGYHFPRIPEPIPPNLVLGPDGQASIVVPEQIISGGMQHTFAIPIPSDVAASSSILDSSSYTSARVQYFTLSPSPSSTSSHPQTLSQLVQQTQSNTNSVPIPSTAESLGLSSLPQSLVPPSSSFSTPVSSSSPFFSSSVSSLPTASLPGEAATSETSTPNTRLVASSHNASHYIGIVFGVIVSIAFIATVIAWWFRVRRREPIDDGIFRVPWAQPDNEARLEEARPPSTFIGRTSAMTEWEFLGDSVGQPRTHQAQAQSLDHRDVLEANRSLPYAIPSDCLGTAEPFARRVGSSESIRDHQHAVHLGPLKVTNLMPGDQPSSFDVNDPFSTGLVGRHAGTIPPECGTPREAVPGARPRFLGLNGQGLAVPWAPLQPRSPRDTENGRGSRNWDLLPPLPFPGESIPDAREGHKTAETWPETLRENLVHAFNAVSHSLKAAGPAINDHTLTQLPSRSHQRLMRDPGKRRPSKVKPSLTDSKTSSIVQKPTAMTEGTWPARMHNLESDRHVERASSLSAGDLSTASVDSNTSLLSIPELPKVATKSRQLSGYFGRRPGITSRLSSGYSASSRRFGYSHPRKPSSSRKRTGKLKSLQLSSEMASASRSISRIPRPEIVTRHSSSTTFRSEASGFTIWTDNEHKARTALRERRIDIERSGEYSVMS